MLILFQTMRHVDREVEGRNAGKQPLLRGVRGGFSEWRRQRDDMRVLKGYRRIC